MPGEHEEIQEMFCTALEMKEKKKDLYEGAMNACVDDVGKETFRMLRDAEAEHGRQIREIYERMKAGSDWEDVCRYHPEEKKDIVAVFRKTAIQRAKDSEVCTTHIGAIDSGIELENAAIRFFETRLSRTKNPAEREFLERMIADEREHFVALADLKFYYSDPHGWYIEKSRSTLDGA